MTISGNALSHISKNELAAKTGRSFWAPVSGKGLSAFDAWLDQALRKTPGILAACDILGTSVSQSGVTPMPSHLVVPCNRKSCCLSSQVCLHRPGKGKEPAGAG